MLDIESPPTERVAATHLDAFRVTHYRGLDGLTLGEVKRVNLVTGANGIGKTALLESLWLFHGRYNPATLWNVHVQRSAVRPTNPLSALSDTGVVELTGVEDGAEHSIRYSFDPRPPGGRGDVPVGPEAVAVTGLLRSDIDGEPANGSPEIAATPGGAVLWWKRQPLSKRPGGVIQTTERATSLRREDLSRYSDMARAGLSDEMSRVLAMVEPRTREFQVLLDKGGEPYLYAVTKGGRARAAQELGAGFVRLCRLLFACFAARGGLLLVDELENGLHHSVLSDLWAHLDRLSREWQVQIFVTSHSYACIAAALEVFEGRPDDLAIHSLFREEPGGPVESVTYTGGALLGVMDLNLEVR